MVINMFCPECGGFICTPKDECTICGYNKKKNKSKNKKTKNKSNKNKQKMKNKTKRNLNRIHGGFLGGKTRIYNARRYHEFEVLGNNYSTYYF